jgi:hypothetical protein
MLTTKLFYLRAISLGVFFLRIGTPLGMVLASFAC